MADFDVSEMDDKSFHGIKALMFTQLVMFLVKTGIYNLVESSRNNYPKLLTVHYHKKND
jgi:hypothetical protein